MNAHDATTTNHGAQPHPRYSPPLQDPLKAAQLHNFALRLDLRRARRDLVGSHKLAAVSRLLDATAAVARSLEWLNGKAEAVHDDFAALEQLAMEPGAIADPEHFARALDRVSLGGTQ